MLTSPSAACQTPSFMPGMVTAARDQNARETGDASLRQLSLSNLRSKYGTLSLGVLRDGRQPVGFVDGLIVDPARRRIHFLLVRLDGDGERRYLLPFAAVCARIDERVRFLDVEVAARDLQEFRRPWAEARYAPFSDDDLVAALFGGAAADASDSAC